MTAYAAQWRGAELEPDHEAATVSLFAKLASSRYPAYLPQIASLESAYHTSKAVSEWKFPEVTNADSRAVTGVVGDEDWLETQGFSQILARPKQ